MKTFIIIIISLFCLTVKAQDTLYFPSGEIQLVELISVNKAEGLIKYTFEGKIQIRSISTLKSYSNQANVSDKNWNVMITTNDPLPGGTNYNSSSIEDPSKYSYGKFSIGANLLSPLFFQGNDLELTISSNYNQSFYVQYNLNKKIGFRLPMRIGFNRLKDSITLESGKYLSNHDRVLSGEGGIEVLFMFDDNRKITPYWMPGIYVGVNQRAISYYEDSTNILTYFPSPKHTYYRIGLTGGFQFNFSKHIQLNTELGFNLNNAHTYYSSTWSNPSKYDVYVQKRLGFQLAVNLVYRFGGRIRE